jgi:hypothetical protein
MEQIEPAPIKPSIEIDTLQRLDLRFGTLVSVGEVAG